MTTKWGIAACMLLALFASSVSANLFDDVAEFVKDSQAMEAFKEKLFDEDYGEAADEMREVSLDASSAADAAGTQVPAFPQLFEGTVLNGFKPEENPEEVPQEEEEQPAEPCDGAVEEQAQQEFEPEQTAVEVQPQAEDSQAEAQVIYLPQQEQVEQMFEPEQAVPEEQQAEQELEELPMVVLQSLQAVLDAEAQSVQEEQFEGPLESALREAEEYCAQVLRQCEAETCAGQRVSENSCTKTEGGFQTSCACGGTATSSFSSPGFSGFSSSSSASMGDRGMGMPADAEGLLRSMFSRRFGPFPRPPFEVEEPQTAPRAVPVMPLLSLLGAFNNLNQAVNVPARPFVSLGMPSFFGDAAPRVVARPMVVPVEEAEEELEEEEPTTVVDITDLLRGPDAVRAMPVSLVRSFPVRLNIFNREAEEPRQYNTEPLQTLEDVPKPVAPAEPVLEEGPAFDPFKWQRSSREWRTAKREELRRLDTWGRVEVEEGPPPPTARCACW